MTTMHGIERYLRPREDRDELLSPTEVAEWLRVKVTTLATWRSDRPQRGPRPQPIGSRIFYRASDVQAWLDEQQGPDPQTADEPLSPRGSTRARRPSTTRKTA